MTTPPPLPSDSPFSASPTSTTPPPLPRRSSAGKYLIGGIAAIVLLAAITIGALAATCPDEPQLRRAVYGEMDPKYKTALEMLGHLSKLAGGPCLMYHNHVVYSTLDFRKTDGNEVRFATGCAGKISLTDNVKETKEFLLSIPLVRKYVEGQ